MSLRLTANLAVAVRCGAVRVGAGTEPRGALMITVSFCLIGAAITPHRRAYVTAYFPVQVCTHSENLPHGGDSRGGGTCTPGCVLPKHAVCC